MRTELVTTLKRRATEVLDQLAADREPVLITHHGLPSAYLVDVESYETLQRRMAILEGIARGERALAEGRILSHAAVERRMQKRLARWRK
jgi:prevent-host-death family protein